jgi:PLD-like domain
MKRAVSYESRGGTGTNMIKLAPQQRDALLPIAKALATFPRDHGIPSLLVVRPGYRYANDADGHVVATPAIVLAVVPGTRDAAAGPAKTLETKLNLPVEIQEASVEEQLSAFDASTHTMVVPDQPKHSPLEEAIRGNELVDFAGPRRPDYQAPPTLKLDRVKEHMKLVLCVSPEAGWPALETFFNAALHTLTIGMYEFTAPHVVEAASNAAGRIDGDVVLTLHPVPEPPAKTGVKSKDTPEADVITSLQEKAGARWGFQWAPVGKTGVFSSAYHIKVAVADSARVWLSSGNWQSSNQPGPAVLADKPDRFQHDYNRDYHAVIDSPTLAAMFEGFLKYDFQLAQDHPHPVPGKWDGPEVVIPDGYQPPVFAAPVQFFEPLVLDRIVDIQPLLTPDNYAAKILEILDGATATIDFQNQYINMSTAGDLPEFEALVGKLVEKQQAGIVVRIICRDLMTSDKLDLLTAKGFDPSFVRFQPACHNKCIIVDNQIIAFGSHNWSNDGAVTNRDASLIFYDPEIAQYFAKVYAYDWERLATAKPTKPRKAAKVAPGDTDSVPLED